MISSRNGTSRPFGTASDNWDKSALDVGQDDVQDHAGEHNNRQIRHKAYKQRPIPSLGALGPCVGLYTEQAAEQRQQGQIAVIAGQKCNNANYSAQNKYLNPPLALSVNWSFNLSKLLSTKDTP